MSEQTIDLPVLGMTCAACVRRVERAVAAVPGVARAEVNLPLSRARIVIDPAVANVHATAEAIRGAGYEVPADVLDANTGAARLAAIERAEREDVGALRRDAAIAIGLTVPLVALAMTVMTAWSLVAQAILGTIVVLWPGRRYFRGGWAAVRHGSPDMNTLIALGAGAAWLASTIVTARWLAGPRTMLPDVYFEAGAAIVAFVMIGKLLESRARARVSEAVRGLVSLAPARARLDDGREVDAAVLAAGDVIAVRPGERLAADGTVVTGASAIDETMLTGESLPVDKCEGSPVYAGTLNQHGALTVRVARAGAETALARIARAVEDAQGGKAPIARIADRVSAWFVPAVLAIGTLTFGGWLVAGASTGVALERMIAVLVIACPCALGLATPAAIAVGTARGAELGVLFEGGGALERASGVDVVAMDKTGTLTEGVPRLASVDGGDEVLRIAASAEQASEHPIARAIVEGAKGLALEKAEAVVVEPGPGMRARVGGRDVRVGTKEFVGASGSESATAFVAVDGNVIGWITVEDRVRDEAMGVVAELRGMGIEPVMITGDREEVARRVAGELGIARVHAGVRPTGKAALVAQERQSHRIAMVGDGINDAPALAAADVGIALGSGSDIAAAAADVTLLRGGIATLPTALALARATMHTIRRNLVAASIYNAVCIPLAVAGLASPMLAAAAMSLSSVSVLLSSLQLRRFRGGSELASGRQVEGGLAPDAERSEAYPG